MVPSTAPKPKPKPRTPVPPPEAPRPKPDPEPKPPSPPERKTPPAPPFPVREPSPAVPPPHSTERAGRNAGRSDEDRLNAWTAQISLFVGALEPALRSAPAVARLLRRHRSVRDLVHTRGARDRAALDRGWRRLKRAWAEAVGDVHEVTGDPAVAATRR